MFVEVNLHFPTSWQPHTGVVSQDRAGGSVGGNDTVQVPPGHRTGATGTPDRLQAAGVQTLRASSITDPQGKGWGCGGLGVCVGGCLRGGNPKHLNVRLDAGEDGLVSGTSDTDNRQIMEKRMSAG